MREDEEKDYFSLNLSRYSKVECLLVRLDGSEEVLSEYMVEVKL